MDMSKEVQKEYHAKFDRAIKKASIKRIAWNETNGGYDCFIHGKLVCYGVDRETALRWYNSGDE